MRILVTGGAGYIGSHAAKALRQSGFDVVVLDNLSMGHRWAVKWGRLIHADLADAADLVSLLRDEGVEAVVHFAASTAVGESVLHPRRYYRNNVVNTLNLLEAMVDAGVGAIVFSSTCATYGDPIRIPIDEDHPQHPINPYGETKLTVERILRAFGDAYGIRWFALRYFNAAGADPDGQIGEDHTPESHLIPLVIEAALGRRSHLEVYGTDYPTPDGTAVRDYIHVTDLADAHVRALRYLLDNGSSTAVNLGTGTGHTIREVIAAVQALSPRPITVRETERRAGDAPILVANSAKAERILGWKPRYSDLASIVGTAFRWHSGHGR